MNNNRFFIAAALLGTVLSACQRVQEEQLPDENTTETWTLTLQATKGLDTRTLVLSNDGKQLDAVWHEGEQVDVFFGETYLGTLTAHTDQGNDGPNATLSGDLNDNASALKADDELTLFFPSRGEESYAWYYNGQQGDLPRDFDYSKATVTVTGKTSGNIIVSGDAVPFVNQQSIYRFKFMLGATEVGLNGFTVYSQNNKLVRSLSMDGTPTYGSIFVNIGQELVNKKEYYVAIRNEYNGGANDPADKYFFTYVDNNAALYEGTKSIPKDKLYDNGKMVTKFMGATVTLTQKTIAAQDTEVTTAL
jgi:hypothetical protein